MSLAAVLAPSPSASLRHKTSNSSKKRKALPISDLSSTTSEVQEPSSDEDGGTTWLALAGINSSESSQKSGKNDHFRVFKVSISSGSPSISLVSKHEFFSPTTEVETYQRLIRTNSSAVAIATGGGLANTAGSEIVVVEVPSLSLKRRIRLPEVEETVDLDLSDGGLLVYCTAKDIFTTSSSGKDGGESLKLAWQSTPPAQGKLRSVRFCGSQKRIIAVLNHPQRTGSELLLIDTTGNGKLLARRKLHKNIRAVTGMDTVSLGPHQNIVSVAGADQSVEILVVEDDKITMVKMFRDVHPFQITKVVFSRASFSNGSIQLATTSMGNTVVVFTLPLILGSDGRRSLLRGSSVVKQTLLSVSLSLIGVAIFAVVLQLVFEARAGLPLPMERNAILSRFNEVLGAKTAEMVVPEELFMVLKEVEDGGDVGQDATHTVTVEHVVTESPVMDVD